jgi:hypothetical protein
MAEDAAERVSRKAPQKIKKPAAAVMTAGFFDIWRCETPESIAVSFRWPDTIVGTRAPKAAACPNHGLDWRGRPALRF